MIPFDKKIFFLNAYRLSLIAIILLTPASADSLVRISPEVSEGIESPPFHFPDYEKLVFDVRWFGIPIGTGTLEIQRETRGGQRVYLIQARAKGNDFLNAFYRVDDYMESRVSPEGFYVLKALKNLKEGRYCAHEEVTFNPEKRRAYYESFTNGTKKVLPLMGPTRDLLGAFYWFRHQPLRPESTVKTIVHVDEKYWELTLKILRLESIEIRNLGRFETFVIEPYASFRGVFITRGRAWVYFTSDSKRIPVKIRLDTPFGPVMGILKEIPSY